MDDFAFKVLNIVKQENGREVREIKNIIKKLRLHLIISTVKQ